MNSGHVLLSYSLDVHQCTFITGEVKYFFLPVNLRFIATHSLHPGSLLFPIGLMELNQHEGLPTT